MVLDKSFFIHTTRNGRLGADTTEADVQTMFDRIRRTDQLVVHFHGGLVDRAAGMATATRLAGEYQPFAHPVFFVWESGIKESPVNNLDEIVAGLASIAREAVFQKLLSVVSKWSVGKLRTEEGGKGPAGQLDLPDDITHAIELRRSRVGDVPYDDLRLAPLDEVGDVQEAERDGLVTELTTDTDFVADVQAVIAGHVEEGDPIRAALPPVVPVATRMDEVVLDELAGEVDPGTKGLFSAALLARKAAAVFARVVRRFVKHRDHGLYPTVVEEILRELYLAGVGGVLWQVIKQETADTFVAVPGEVRGGELFLRKLAELGDDRPKQIVLVGHSTGAVFIDEMIAATREARRNGVLPPDFAYSGVVFLAPACTFAHFAKALPAAGEPPIFKDFRMFTMDDDHEQKNWLVPGVYPRSLLYFVSGVVEREVDGSGAFDMPVVGMDRYYGRAAGADAYGALGPEIAAVRSFVSSGRRVVWSPSPAGSADGQRADAVAHGGFDDTVSDDGSPPRRAVIDSVRHILERGWS